MVKRQQYPYTTRKHYNLYSYKQTQALGYYTKRHTITIRHYTFRIWQDLFAQKKTTISPHLPFCSFTLHFHSLLGVIIWIVGILLLPKTTSTSILEALDLSTTTSLSTIAFLLISTTTSHHSTGDVLVIKFILIFLRYTL